MNNSKKCRAICRHGQQSVNIWYGPIRFDSLMAQADLGDHFKNCIYADGSVIYEGDILWTDK